jgi:hypothetical protein
MIRVLFGVPPPTAGILNISILLAAMLGIA